MEDNVVNISADEQATAPTESTEVENNESEVTDSSYESESTQETDSSESDESEATDESDATTDETEGDDSQERPRGAEARKQQLNTEIRDLVAQRNQIAAQVEQLNAQAYQVATAESLLDEVNPKTGEYYSQLEAQVESMRQERELERYNTYVANTQFAIETEAQRALQDFPRFNPDSPEFDAETAEEVAQILSGALQYDQNTGQLVGSTIPIYQLYKSYDRAAQASAKRAEIKGQKSAEKMMSSADRTSGGQGKTTSFEKLSLSEMEARLRKKGVDV